MLQFFILPCSLLTYSSPSVLIQVSDSKDVCTSLESLTPTTNMVGPQHPNLMHQLQTSFSSLYYPQASITAQASFIDTKEC